MSDAALLTGEHLTVLQAGPEHASAEFRVGLRSMPFLADHAVQSMVVLPGSFCIEMARRLEQSLSPETHVLIRDVNFHRFITLTAEDTVIRVDVRRRSDRSVTHTFRDAGSSGRDDAGTPAATMTIRRTAATPGEVCIDPMDIDASRRSASPTDAERFYERLRASGNHYGPAFQRVVSIWRTGDRALGLLTVGSRNMTAGRASLHPGVLDSMTQLLASLTMDQGKTFILRSIDRVDIMDGELPAELWALARLQDGRDQDSRGFIGNVCAFDGSGRQRVELSGVAFACLDPTENETGSATRFVIAANFTAEPIEDSLKFWGAQFGVPMQVTFAPYDQVFQQLLDPGSLLRVNRDGVNVVLLNLEEWAGRERTTNLTLAAERAHHFDGHRRCTLPNGLEIVHLNAYETDYLYKEIFEDQVYVRHGIELPDGATVLDIGANIGLFSLFVLGRCRNPAIFAFEPAPMVHELLKANCDAHGSNVRTVNAGLAAEPGSATFTFYDQSSVFSGFHADDNEDLATVRTVIRNTLSHTTASDPDAIERHAGVLTDGRLRSTTHECRLTTVSEVIRENGIERIDLLKIDAEKSEWDILEGIAPSDWPRIRQVVIEIHDRTRELVQRIEALLGAKGFRCVVEHEQLLEDSGLYTLYATQADAAVKAETLPAARPSRLLRNVQDLCTALHEATKQGATPLVLCIAPRTPAAEADPDRNAALDDAEQRLLADASAIANVHTISSASLRERYPVEDSYDPHGHHLGNIPYTPNGYAAVGTAVFRTVASLRRRPFKVIVLDCDNTLWKGVCGEDGTHGVDVSGPYRALQELLIDQTNAGMLLCVCSRNNERDVLDVFDQRHDMKLRREHVVAWRVNWQRKSDNVKSLAQELDLALDSFIFIDDDPVECADVRINCPGVLALQLPSDRESVAAFLRHVWAFDHSATTAEDHSRTRMYRENTKRLQFRAQTQLLRDFIRGLELRVGVNDIAPVDLDRASQLTFRTNQFNLTTIRRSRREIEEFLVRPGAAGLVVQVTDRFGDYGLVGVVLYESMDDRYRVDTLLLSCRALGRGVEHAVLSQLGARAVRDGKRFVELTYRPTERNAPIKEFLRTLDSASRDGDDAVWLLRADRLAKLEYDPTDAEADASADTESRDPSRAAKPGFRDRDPSELLVRIAEQLRDIDQIADAIEEYRLRDEAGRSTPDLAPLGTMEAELVGIWRRVLGRSRIGIHDNFFEVGGTSLKAVQVLALIKRELQRDLSIVNLFESPTVSLLAKRLRSGSAGSDAADASQAALRGNRRRQALQRRVS